MDLLEYDIKECVRNLSSVKVLERKKRVEELRAYVHRDEVINIINRCSTDESSSLTWDNIFTASHQALILESDRISGELSKGKNVTTLFNNKTSYTALLTFIVSKGNSGEPKLKCSSLVTAVLQVLESNRHKHVIADTYLSILHQWILPKRNYWGELSIHWNDLLNVVEKMYESGPERCGKSVILSVLQLIVQYGCQHSFLALNMKKTIFGFLRKIMRDVSSDKSIDFQENVLSVTVTVCQQVKYECRIAMCKLSEDIMDVVLGMYERRIEGLSNKKRLLFDLLILFVQIHHPEGAEEGSKIAYAHDWTKWKQCLTKIYSLILTEIRNIQQSSKLLKLNANFLKLAICVSKQVFKDNSNFVNITMNDSMNETSCKRRRLVTGVDELIETLKLSAGSIDAWPWFEFVKELLHIHPDIINLLDYTELLETMKGLLSISKEPIITSFIYSCCCCLIDVRTRLLNLNMQLPSSELSVWQSIWNILLRTVGLNQSVQSSHQLLTCLIAIVDKPSVVNGVVKLFVSGVIKLSHASLTTLNHLNKTTCFPDTILGTPVSESLYDWLLPDSMQYYEMNEFMSYFQLPMDTLADTLISFSLKHNNKVYNNNAIYKKDEKDDFQQHYISASFANSQLLLPDTINNKYESHRFTQNENEFSECKECMMDMLFDKVCAIKCRLLQVCKEDGDNNNNALSCLCNFILLLLHIDKSLVSFHIHHSNKIKCMVDDVMYSLIVITKNIIKQYSCSVNVEEMLKVLSYFLSSIVDISSSSRRVLNHSGMFSLIKDIFALLTQPDKHNPDNDDFYESDNSDNNTRCASIVDFQSLSQKDRIKLESVKIVMLYATGVDSNEQQRQAMESIINYVNELDHTSIASFQICVEVVRSLLKMNSITDETLIMISKIIRDLCRAGNWHKTVESVNCILALLQDTIKRAYKTDDGEVWENMGILITALHRFATNGQYGPNTVVSVVQTLALFHKPGCLDADDDVLSNVLHYLSSPFSQVRMSSIAHVALLFKLLQQSANSTKFYEMYTKFGTAICDSFWLDGEPSDDEREDEGITRTASVLHSLAAVICTCVKIKRPSLLLIFKLTQQKKLNAVLIRRVLLAISKNIGLQNTNHFLKDHLVYILWNWHHEFSTLQNFPWMALNCESIEEFYSKYAKYIVPLMIHKNDVQLINDMTGKTQTPLSHLIKDHFAVTISLLVPRLCNDKVWNGLATTEQVHTTMVQAIGNDVIEEMMSRMLPNVLVCILRLLHNPSNCTNLLNTPPLIYYNSEQIIQTTKYLQQSCPEPEIPLLLYVSYEFPYKIQQMFLHLYIDIMNSSTIEIRMESFERYALFCDMLLPHYQHVKFKSISPFVTNTILKSLNNIINNNSNSEYYAFRFKVVSFLKSFLHKSSKVDGAVIEKHLNQLVATLVSITKHNDQLGRECISILKYLLTQKDDVLKINIKSFPNDAIFDELRGTGNNDDHISLHQQMKDFIQCSTNNNIALQQLKHLNKQLIEKRGELNGIQKMIDQERKDNRGVVLHDVISSLVKMINYDDQQVKEEAAKCLGQIGVVDLDTLVIGLQSDDYNNDINNNADSMLINVVIDSLIECLIANDSIIMYNASNALYVLFSNKQAANVAETSLNELQKRIMYPFFKQIESDDVLGSYFDVNHFENVVNDESLWCPLVNNNDHRQWIVKLCTGLLHSFPNTKCFLIHIVQVCKLQSCVAENVTPYLIYVILQHYTQLASKVFTEQINSFFNKHVSTDMMMNNKESLEFMLKVVDLIRIKRKNVNKYDLGLNYLHVAKAALFCSQYFKALLYAEIYINISSYREDNDMCNEECNEERKMLQNILYQVYTILGDCDAIDGCASFLFTQPDALMKYNKLIGNWQQVMIDCNSQLTHNPRNYTAIKDLSEALDFKGLHYLQHEYLKSFNEDDYEGLTDKLYENSLKMMKVDVNKMHKQTDSYNYHHYMALMNINNNNFSKFHVKCARQHLIEKQLSLTCLQSANHLYSSISKLQCLQEIDEILMEGSIDAKVLITKWNEKNKLKRNVHLRHFKSIFTQRMNILKPLKEKHAASFALDLCKLAKLEADYEYAQTCLDAFVSSSPKLQIHAKFQQAELYWHKGHTDIARHLLNNLRQKSEVMQDSQFESIVLRTYGTWLLHTNLENAETVFEKYFTPARLLIEHCGDDDGSRRNRLATYKCISEFADNQYEQIWKYMKSDLFQEREKNAKEVSRMVSEFSTVINDEKEKMIAKRQLTEIGHLDEKEMESIKRKRSTYLLIAIEYYLKCIMECDEQDLRVFRLISLWMDNRKHDFQKHLDFIHNIPSYQFISVLPQLLAHVSVDQSNASSALLHHLIERCTIEHPHHTLPLIFALHNANKDDKKRTKSDDEPRVQFARQLIQKLRDKNTLIQEIHQFEQLSNAYISLANFNGSEDNKQSKMTIPLSQPLSKMTNLDRILCPTIQLAVRKSADYSDVIGIHKFERIFVVVNGINRPKKISCVGTDGVCRPQLLKGQDDLRSDAVMQQVFDIINKLLNENKKTRERKLHIRGYKVVPLSKRSGIVEWCCNTESIAEYLTGASGRAGAHQRYRPHDMAVNVARRLLMNTAKSTNEKKEEVYLKICEKLKPVFRYFFLERFSSASSWYERKLAYIHSVATTSIVGYILGIGDRHFSNILIDETTAEVIHIDFGIAFEGGLLLKTPETVPFRLTRDIEDAMGIFSVDGIFRRCCEKSLDVLRENQNIIKTTLEVFLYDPLYNWTITPEKAATFQDKKYKRTKLNVEYDNNGGTSGQINNMAERVLSRIRLKLQGLEEGMPTTIEGQVNRLIQEARDSKNLCRIFHGWQAYL